MYRSLYDNISERLKKRADPRLMRRYFARLRALKPATRQILDKDGKRIDIVVEGERRARSNGLLDD